MKKGTVALIAVVATLAVVAGGVAATKYAQKQGVAMPWDSESTTVTLTDYFYVDVDNLTDAQKAVGAEYDGGTITFPNDMVVGGGGSIRCSLDTSYVFGDRLVVADKALIEAGLTCADSGVTMAVTGSQTTLRYAVDKVAVDGFKSGDVVSDAHCYDLSTFGYASAAKANAVFDKLTADLKHVDGDLTFKKADVLKFAQEYDDGLAAASSDAGSSAA